MSVRGWQRVQRVSMGASWWLIISLVTHVREQGHARGELEYIGEEAVG